MDDLRLAVAAAIRTVRAGVQWKPGKDAPHLQKRQAMGHLPVSASLTDYNVLIQSVVYDANGQVFVYRLGQDPYVAIRGNVAGRPWLVIFSMAGIMETAFPPDDIDDYLTQPGFIEIGTIQELLA